VTRDRDQRRAPDRGRLLFADLAPGDRLDGVEIVALRTAPYTQARTHDALPDPDTGTHVAGGVHIGSTRAPRR
jgi:hypothetical protein